VNTLHRFRIAAPTVLACAALAAVGLHVAGAGSAPTAKREALAGIQNPAGAKGRTLGLSRVTVPGHAILAAHHHPGTQTAYIDQGTLTYTVYRGHVDVMQGDADNHPTRVRHIAAGQTGQIKAGQWIVEQPTTHHMAQNKGHKAIVIYLATLFPNGAPPAIPDASH
jgi:quercetin dioxygenase-like cupin family protein